MNEKDSIQALERQARNTNRLMDNLCLAWKGRTWEEAHMDYTFEDYRKALEGAGPKLKELILDRAVRRARIEQPRTIPLDTVYRLQGEKSRRFL